MRVRVEPVPDLDETEVVIRCRDHDEAVDRVINALGLFERVVIGKKDGRSFRLPPADIYFFEVVDDRTWVNLHTEVYETSLRLYELEELLRNTTFVRISRTTIVNAAHIRSFRSAVNGRMEARLDNGETVEITRSYVNAMKTLLGGMPR